MDTRGEDVQTLLQLSLERIRLSKISNGKARECLRRADDLIRRSDELLFQNSRSELIKHSGADQKRTSWHRAGWPLTW